MLTQTNLRQPALRLPEICCLYLSPSVFNLVTLHSVVWPKPHSTGKNSSWDWSYCFPLGCSCSEWSGLPKPDGCCCIGVGSAPGSQQLLSSSLPKASITSLSSSISSPLCSPPHPFARDLLSVAVSLSC